MNTASLPKQLFRIAAACIALAPAVHNRLAAQNPVPDSAAPLVLTTARTISAVLPPYTLRLTANADTTGIRRIDIHRGGSLVQTIDNTGMDDVITGNDLDSTALDVVVHTADLNFDGYADLWLMQFRGPYEQQFAYWIFNPKSGRFQYSRSMSGECGYPALHADTRTVELYCNGGAPGVLYDQHIYRYSNGRFILTRHETQEEYGPDDTRVIRTTGTLRNGRLVTKQRVIRKKDLDTN